MLIKFAIPLLFVFLWSTGFIGAKYGLPYAEPMTFLAVRMSATLLILALMLPFFKVRWPTRKIDYVHLSVVGILIHGIYLGGVFSAVYFGLPASISAIIVGLQPIITMLFAIVWLKESLSPLKLFGLVIGFSGIIMVVGEHGISSGHFHTLGVTLSVISLFAISIGTVYQKKFCGGLDLLPGVFIQYAANTVFTTVLAFSLETREIDWNISFILALGWLVFVLSIGAVLLLMWLIRQGEAGGVASLFYLVPPFVSIEAWFLFGERFGLIGFIGILCCVAGVAIVLRNTTKAN